MRPAYGLYREVSAKVTGQVFSGAEQLHMRDLDCHRVVVQHHRAGRYSILHRCFDIESVMPNAASPMESTQNLSGAATFGTNRQAKTCAKLTATCPNPVATWCGGAIRQQLVAGCRSRRVTRWPAWGRSRGWVLTSRDRRDGRSSRSAWRASAAARLRARRRSAAGEAFVPFAEACSFTASTSTCQCQARIAEDADLCLVPLAQIARVVRRVNDRTPFGNGGRGRRGYPRSSPAPMPRMPAFVYRKCAPSPTAGEMNRHWKRGARARFCSLLLAVHGGHHRAACRSSASCTSSAACRLRIQHTLPRQDHRGIAFTQQLCGVLTSCGSGADRVWRNGV